MEHFPYQQPHSNILPAAGHPHQPQQQPLTPISNITSNHASYHHNDSAAPPNILPPLHSQPNSHLQYPPSSTLKNGHDLSIPKIPHTPDTPSSIEGHAHSLPHLAPQQHMNVQEPQVTSWAGPTHHGYHDTSPNSYHAPSQPTNGFSMPSIAHYSQAPSSQLHASINAIHDRAPPPQSQPTYGYTSPVHHQETGDSLTSPEDGRPMPVVGSQGRRGILPSLGTRPPPVGSMPDGSMRGVPQVAKNSDNKYQCNFCTKTYLHLKHLKRHHLRHTGERPYQCSLCHETFCRSDILKRHFSKCAIRRGNPTGANHLTHAQAHLNKPPRTAPNSSNGTSAPPPMSSLSAISTSQPPSSYQQGPWSATTARSSATASLDQNQFPVGDSTRTSRSSSLMGPDGQVEDDRKRYSAGATSLAPSNGNVETSTNGAHGHERPFSYPFGSDRQMPPTFRDANTNGFSYPSSMAQQSEQQLPPMSGYMRTTNGWPQPYSGGANDNHQNWSNCFTPGGQDSLMYNAHHT